MRLSETKVVQPLDRGTIVIVDESADKEVVLTLEEQQQLLLYLKIVHPPF